MKSSVFPAARRIIGALLGAALLPTAALAGAADDAYIAARDKYVAALAAAEKAGTNPDAVYKQDDRARADLKAQMMALLGPLAFKGLEKAGEFSPGTLLSGQLETGQPDGLLFRDKKDETRIFISPVPVLTHWARQDADFKAGDALATVLASGPFYTQATGSDAAFEPYVPVPLTAGEGEVVFAFVGLFAQDDTANYPPASVVVGWMANGRVVVGTTPMPEARKTFPACTKAWEATMAKAKALEAAAQKQKGARKDEMMAQVFDMHGPVGSAAYRTCYAGEVVKQPVFATIVKKTEALLQKMRGN